MKKKRRAVSNGRASGWYLTEALKVKISDKYIKQIIDPYFQAIDLLKVGKGGIRTHVALLNRLFLYRNILAHLNHVDMKHSNKNKLEIFLLEFSIMRDVFFQRIEPIIDRINDRASKSDKTIYVTVDEYDQLCEIGEKLKYLLKLIPAVYLREAGAMGKPLLLSNISSTPELDRYRISYCYLDENNDQVFITVGD